MNFLFKEHHLFKYKSFVTLECLFATFDQFNAYLLKKALHSFLCTSTGRNFTSALIYKLCWALILHYQKSS